MNAGDLPAKEVAAGPSAGVRAAIVAVKPGNSGGAKGGRKADAPSEEDRESESEPSSVPERDKQGGEDLWQRHKAQRGVWSEGMLMALDKGVKGNKWFSLIDKIQSQRTLGQAWEKVRVNAGACGVDGITVEMFQKDSPTRLLAVKKQLKENSYQPTPVKRVWIPKPGSAQMRPLGIPTVKDRVVQAATRMVIEPIFEREFAPQSYGFRPGRGCKDALRRVDELLKEGNLHVVDIDIKGYFDGIPHERLLELVGEEIADGRVIDLLRQWLRAGVMEEGERQETEEGTPQGGVISPLLANIYLNPLDWLMNRAGLEMVRYADDMVVLCGDPETARAALERVTGWMKTAGLELHPEKTKVVNMAQAGNRFDFLGYRFRRTRRGGISRDIREKSLKKRRERIKPLTRRSNGESLGKVIATINPILRGWYGYFKQAREQVHVVVDGWVRGRLRGILRHRQGKRGRGRGSDHQRWRNPYFDQHGLFSLEAARAREHINLRRGNEAC